MTKTAWVFPGQGSQAIGMGTDLITVPTAKARFEQAERILGWSVLEICQSPEDKVSQTLYTQPCLYVIETILVDLLRARGQSPDLVAGHSLGEYVALYTAGVFDFETGLKLVKQRAELMDRAKDGSMVALLGFDQNQLNQLLQQSEEVFLANDNSSGQVVLSGTIAALDAFLPQVKAKKVVQLHVSGAFHSPYMTAASDKFQPLLEAVTFEDARIPVLSNVEPEPAVKAEVLKERLIRQITGSVRWREISLALAEAGVTQVVEVGPGKVLTGLMKRSFSGVTLQNITGLADLPELPSSSTQDLDNSPLPINPNPLPIL